RLRPRGGADPRLGGARRGAQRLQTPAVDAGGVRPVRPRGGARAHALSPAGGLDRGRDPVHRRAGADDPRFAQEETMKKRRARVPGPRRAVTWITIGIGVIAAMVLITTAGDKPAILVFGQGLRIGVGLLCWALA